MTIDPFATETAAPKYPATPAQVNYATNLIGQKVAAELREAAIAKLATMEKRDVSELIDALKSMPYLPREAAKPVETAELEAGMYRRDGVIYKVQRAVHGSGRMYAKRLVVEEYENGEGVTETAVSFEYANGAIRSLTAAHRMSLEEAKEFGAIYGVCCVCAATLTDEKSIAAGIGPVCGGRV